MNICVFLVTLVEFETEESFDGCTMLHGFPSATLTSILVSGFMRETLDLPMVAVITSPSFPPRCLIENSVPVHPVRIFANKDIAIVQCEFKVSFVVL